VRPLGCIRGGVVKDQEKQTATTKERLLFSKSLARGGGPQGKGPDRNDLVSEDQSVIKEEKGIK